MNYKTVVSIRALNTAAGETSARQVGKQPKLKLSIFPCISHKIIK